MTFRCFTGDKVEANILVPVCNWERENAIVMAAEQRMSETELKRRKLHGVLSSKSLLEALERLTLNKNTKPVQKTSAKDKLKVKKSIRNFFLSKMISSLF